MQKSDSKDTIEETISVSVPSDSTTLSDASSPVSPSASRNKSRNNRFTNALKSIRSKKLVGKKSKMDEEKKSETNKKQTVEFENALAVAPSHDKKSKKTKAANLAKKFGIGSMKKHKIGPKQQERGGTDDGSSSSNAPTPNSLKRQTPEGGNLSVSDTSLADINEGNGNQDNTVNDKNSKESDILGIALTDGEKNEKQENFIETSKASSVNIELPPQGEVSEANLDSLLDEKSSLLKSNTISASDIIDQVSPQGNSDGANQKIVGIVDNSQSTPSGRTEILPKPAVGIKPTVKKQSIKSKLIKKFHITESSRDKPPSTKAPAVPYNISEAEVSNIIHEGQGKIAASSGGLMHLVDHSSATVQPSKSTDDFAYQEKSDNSSSDIKRDLEQSKLKKRLSREEFFDSFAFMKKPEDLTTPSASDTKLSSSENTTEAKPISTVRVQKSSQTYQLGNNLKNPNLSPFKEVPSGTVTDDSTVKDQGIKFDIGTAVRPPRNLANIRHITSLESDCGNLSSREEFSSLEETKSSESLSPSEHLRRRIAYVSQPTLDNEPELKLTENKAQPLSHLTGLSSELSLDSDFSPDINKMPPIGDLMVDNASPNMAPVQGKKEHLYKILVIGDLGTGKTSFIKRYVHQFFSNNYRATIGVDFALKVIPWDENTVVRLQLWDIAGQERFGNMTRVYYKEAVGAFIVFDVSRTGTFDAVIKWKQDLDNKVQLPDGSNIPCMLIGNKCDQDKVGLVNNPAKMDEFVKIHKFAGWFETSAKENINIEESAKALVTKILLNDKTVSVDSIDNDRFALNGTAEPTNKSCAC